MRQMIDAHEATAQSTGAPSCFPAARFAPFELGVFFVEETAKQVLGAPVQTASKAASHMNGTFRRHRGQHQGDVRGCCRKISVWCQLKNPFVLTRDRGSEAAAGQQAALAKR